MDTSIRFSSQTKALRIHAKQEIPLPIETDTLLQVRAELDTTNGAPSCVAAMIRHFFPDSSASVGVGLEYDRNEKLRFNLHGKKGFPVTNDDSLWFYMKGRCALNKSSRKLMPHGAAEFAWNIIDFQDEQDIRLKVGFEVFDKVPYLQIQETDWTVNVDIRGRWNVRYDIDM